MHLIALTAAQDRGLETPTLKPCRGAREMVQFGKRLFCSMKTPVLSEDPLPHQHTQKMLSSAYPGSFPAGEWRRAKLWGAGLSG